MIQNMIGVEAEYFLVNAKTGEATIPPSYYDRDDFPLLGEIRSDPGETTGKVYASYIEKQTGIIKDLGSKTNRINFSARKRINLKTYRKATSQITTNKQDTIGKVENIYGVDISDYSDQIIGDNNKIQGIYASCGLHIHFSSEVKDERKIKMPKYEQMYIPLSINNNGTSMEMTMPLYKCDGYDVAETITVRASRITNPVIQWIVEEMDKKFFDKFAPIENERTKYRRPGFYEIKPYGFEYRSLPANDASIAALPEIIDFAFELLNKL